MQLYETGQLRLSGEFVDGLPNGKWELWHDNQTLRVVSVLTADGFYPEKDGCSFLAGDWDEICLDNFGQLDGAFKHWHENGQLELDLTFKDGQLDGLQKVWYENGQLQSEGTHKDGVLEGPLKSWNENGQLTFEGTVEDGEWLSSNSVQ
tara:strand:- start:148 stop:594 length:447 start_codon:yes stop_codon:yes gene_type:complete